MDSLVEQKKPQIELNKRIKWFELWIRNPAYQLKHEFVVQASVRYEHVEKNRPAFVYMIFFNFLAQFL